MIITLANQKGGVGKSTTAVTLCAGLTQRGYKTLLVDLDSQANSTWTARVEGDGAYEMLSGSKTAREVIQHSESCGDVIAASYMLDDMPAVLNKFRAGKEYRLKKCLEDVKDDYDFIIIDTPRSLGIELINALAASDSVIVPVFSDGYAVSGTMDIANTIESVKEYVNPDLSPLGILIGRVDHRETVGEDMRKALEDIAPQLGIPLIGFDIRSATAIPKASVNRQNIYEYLRRPSDRKDSVIDDYEHLIDLVVEKGGCKE